MKNLVSRSPKSITAIVGVDEYCANFGLLTSPRASHSIEAAVSIGAKWASDNDCYAFWSRGEQYATEPLIRFMIRWKQYAGECLFVNAPDILHDARATLENFWYWRDIIRAYGYPVAFTVQDGIEKYPPPWGYFDALFIGSTNKVKYSHHVAGLVKQANERGIWVHNGRVNTKQAVRYSKNIGCNSFDGTKFTHEPPKVLDVLPFQKNTYQTLFNMEEIE